MAGFLISVAASVLAALGLWAVLPRGVVLTRFVREPGTWSIRNDSALPVRITSVTVQGVGTFDDNYTGSGGFPEIDLPVVEQGRDYGASLKFDDDTTEFRRLDWAEPWKGQRLLPGDTLAAAVKTNTTLRIKYRRAGRLGVFERREIRVDGFI